MVLWERIHFPIWETVETWVQPLGEEDPLEGVVATIPVFLPGKFHRQRSLAGYSTWGPQRVRHD